MSVTLIKVAVNKYVLTLLEALCVLVILDLVVTSSAQVKSTQYYWITTLFTYFLDIDECSKGISGCTQGCINSVGSYFCTCQTGYYLDSDNTTCLGLCV